MYLQPSSTGPSTFALGASPSDSAGRFARTMEGVYYELDTEAQFWGEIDEILSPVNNTSTETCIRNFVRFAAAFRGTLLLPLWTGDTDL